MYKDSFKFDSVVVLETLAADESRTGEWLFDRVLQPWQRADPYFHTELKVARSRQALFRALDEVVRDYSRKGHSPIVHIEAHGVVDDKDRAVGLELANGDQVLWEPLRDRLTEINGLSRFNLLVVFAMCAGWHGAGLLHPNNAAPAWGVIGTTNANVKAVDLREAMEAFYMTLRWSLDARKALDAMNASRPIADWEYRLTTAEMMFARVFRHYVDVLCTPDQLQARENEIVAEIVRRRGGDLLAGMDARERARRMLREHSELFQHYREPFLMLDTWPDNAPRFALTYNEYLRLAQAGA